MCILGTGDLNFVLFICYHKTCTDGPWYTLRVPYMMLNTYVVTLSSDVDKDRCTTVSLMHLQCRKFLPHKCEGSTPLGEPDCTFISQNRVFHMVVCRQLMLLDKEILESFLMNEN